MPRDVKRVWDAIVKAMIEELGGPEMAARRLAARGMSPLDMAIFMAGGKAAVADKMGKSRQGFYNLLKRPLKDWTLGDINRLAEISEVPAIVLLESATKRAKGEPDTKPRPKKK